VVVSFKTVSDNGHFALEWIKNEAFGHKVVDSRTGEVFPHLKLFWEKVNGLTPEQATVFLREQLEESTRGTLSFFGIPVERNLAIATAPIVCFSILLFLVLHIRHLRQISDGIAWIPTYPFVPIFKGAVGALLVTYITVLALPIAANAELLMRFGTWEDGSTKVGAVFAALTAVVSVWTVSELHFLRKRLFTV
jgi:hypothetical protein